MLSTASVILASLLTCAPPQESAEIAWETDLGAAVDRALETGRPLLIVFR
jgi:hypothetical protein